jgi:hypothetical protein
VSLNYALRNAMQRAAECRANRSQVTVAVTNLLQNRDSPMKKPCKHGRIRAGYFAEVVLGTTDKMAVRMGSSSGDQQARISADSRKHAPRMSSAS